MKIEYETFRLREGEFFKVFIDSQLMLEETAENVDKDGFSQKKTATKEFSLN